MLSKIIYPFLVTLLFFMFHPSLEAGGWGKTDEVFEQEGTLWNGVFFDMNGFYFKALIPNYSGTTLQNGLVHLEGGIEEIEYAIITTFSPGFTPPKTEREFVALIQNANPSYKVIAVNSKKAGVKYIVDMISTTQGGPFWRFFTTQDRLIKMGTNDDNELRRLYFFESFSLKT